MQKNNTGVKVVSLLALCLAVVGISLGYAAFSETLKISSSAEVSPDSAAFNVDFSTSSDSVVAGDVTGEVTGTGATAGTATIDNTTDSISKITGLKANFTDIGQSVSYSFYAYNSGSYDAYLKSITYETLSGGDSFKSCTAGENTDATMVATACDTISVSVKVGSEDAVTSTTQLSSEHKLATSTSEPIVVTITYAGDSTASNSGRTDGDFTVSFGDISLLYQSVN